MPRLTIVIPTYRRREVLGGERPVLAETLERLRGIRGEWPDSETLVVHHGPADGHEDAVGWIDPGEARVLRCRSASLAAARNVAVEAATGEVLLFLNDDAWARPVLLAAHGRFHEAHPEAEAALIGRAALAEDIEPTEFMRWLDGSGVQFGYRDIDAEGRVPGRHLYTINASLKTSLVRDASGFDERFVYGNDDTELGLRLERAGMRLFYNPDAVVDHHHAIDLRSQLRRMRDFGASYRLLVEAFPEEPPATSPSTRHRIGAAMLTALWSARARPRAVRHAVWRFLCHEAHREGYWGIGADGGVQIGAKLARAAEEDPRAGPPRPVAARAPRAELKTGEAAA